MARRAPTCQALFSGLPKPLRDLVNSYREQAEAYGRDGAKVDARAVLNRVAEEVEQRWMEWCDEELSVAQSAEWGGYSEYQLRAKVRGREIPDNRPPGSQGEIRIPRRLVPIKTGPNGTPSVVQELADRLSGKRGP